MLKIQPVKWSSLNQRLSGTFPTGPDTSAPFLDETRFFNRNLSWIKFNGRVLSEAADPTVPPMERLRFLGIVSSNLDEFFMIRVAEVARMARRNPKHRFLDGHSASQLLAQIREYVLNQKDRQAVVFKEVLGVLKKEGIEILTMFDHETSFDRSILNNLPATKFFLRKTSETFPALESDRLHVFVRFPGEYAILTIPERDARLLSISPSRPCRFVLVDRWLASRAHRLFPGRQVLEAFPFKLIRDADLRYRPDEDDPIEDQIEDAIRQRSKAKFVRLEIDSPHYSEGAFFLATSLGLDSATLYRVNMPLDIRTLSTISNIKPARRLLYPAIQPALPKEWLNEKNVFQLITKKDILLHHPYDSFEIVVKFLENAAKDPHVTQITHTLYRTSKESPIMEALKLAARNGKKVTVYIEIKARFDELNNVRWANELKKTGARVVRPMSGYKVHCKMTQVLRKEDTKTVSYLHLGTGNYHPTTARQYTDLGLLTKNEELGKEAKLFFLALSSRRIPKDLSFLQVAPGNLHQETVRLIKNETAIQKKGGRGHIIAKMNALVDPDVIESLYDASKAGVRIQLLVRGICCLRPGVKGLSENITVFSVVDRFLEHSRIYYFRSNGERKIYLSSADWMPRNFHRRYEIAFPILDKTLKKYIRDVILVNTLSDNLRSWRLLPDGTYVKNEPKVGEKLARSQLSFEVLARRGYQGTVLSKRENAL